MIRLAAKYSWTLLACLSMTTWAQTASVSWSPEHIANGSPCLFTVHIPSAQSVTGTWQGHTISFFRGPSPETWEALAGVDVEVKPGSYPLQIDAVLLDGSKQHIERTLTVEEAPYQSTTLSVPDKFVSPSPAALKRIAAESELKKKAFASTAPIPLWSGSFTPPLPTAPRTDSFGTRRIFNGSLASVHRGLDYRAKTGTPIAAINSGRVLLARSLYYEGNCVIIDHGQGFITFYMHLSRFKVHQGELVRRGQIVGLSGATGRVTGPHLHLGVRWQGAYLDAARLFSLQLPRTSHKSSDE
ncbi:MAG TPA: M23 family metallopeptidase [Edaphobacter sp.]